MVGCLSLSKFLRRGAALGLVLAAAACTVGPDYKKPETALPAAWVSENAKIDETTTAVNWWDHFNDPVLTQLIQAAVSGNFDLKIAEARIDQSRASQSNAFAALLPTGDLSASVNRQANRIAFPDASSFGDGFGKLLTKPFNTYQTGFDASWELDLFGGHRRDLEAADASLEAADATRADTIVSLMAEVARTYIDIRQYQAQLALTEDTLKLDKNTVDIAQQRFNAGEAPKIDLTQAQAELEEEQAQLPYYTNLLRQTEFSMDVLIGAQPGATETIITTTAPIPVSDEAVVLTAPASVIADRPDIRVAERKLASTTAQQGSAVAKFFPDISLSGFFGLLNTQSGQLFKWGSNSWEAAASMTWPILSYGELEANLDEANGMQKEAMATYQKTIIMALSDVERSYTAYTQEERFREALGKSVADNKLADKIARERYREGLTSFIDVLNAERTLYASQSRMAAADAEASQDMIAVYKSLGGGWQSQAPSAAPDIAAPAVSTYAAGSTAGTSPTMNTPLKTEDGPKGNLQPSVTPTQVTAPPAATPFKPS